MANRRTGKNGRPGNREVRPTPRTLTENTQQLIGQRRFEEAIQKLKEARARNPADAEVHFCIGLVLIRQGQVAHAINSWLSALKCDEMHKPSWMQLIYSYRESGRFDEGLKLCSEARRLFPDDETVLMSCAELVVRAGNAPRAIGLLRQAADLAPSNYLIHSRLAALLLQCRQKEEALEHSGRAIDLAGLQPIAVHAHADALRRNGQLEELVAFLRDVVTQAPSDASFRQQLARALERAGDMDEAAQAAREAVRTFPDSRPLLSLYCDLLRATGDCEEHERIVTACYNAHPEDALSRVLMANLHHARGRLDEAEKEYRFALSIRPDLPDARAGLGMVLLAKANWNEGWPHYDARLYTQNTPIRIKPPFALWDGTTDRSLKLLVVDEQGLGDTIQFSRFLPLARERVGEVHFLGDGKLSRLLGQVDPAFASPLDTLDISTADARNWRWIPLMSLANVLAVAETDFAAGAPYLAAEEAVAEHWRATIGGSGTRIGIAWQGNPKSAVEAGRSLPLKAFEPIASLDGIALVSLQKFHGLEQLDEIDFRDRITLPSNDFDAGGDAFIDTAAVMAGLDLVITSDTSIAHLAGAMGRPVWVALSANPEWRWQLGREDSPWYPSMRLFRQETPGDWDGVMRRMRDALVEDLKASEGGA